MAQKSPSIIFLIPAYNEEKNIGHLLESILSLRLNGVLGQIIIVDDGSTDNTNKIVLSYKNKLPIKIIKHEMNIGADEAFKSGFKEILKSASDEDIIVSTEADNTSDLSILNQMIGKFEENYDIVLASCYMSGGGIIGTNIYKIILSKTANWIIRKLFNLENIFTYSSFYRAYKVYAIRKAFLRYGDRFITEKGFVFAVEMLVRLNAMGLRIAEVPMTLNCNNRKDRSKMKVLQTMKGYLLFIYHNIKVRE